MKPTINPRLVVTNVDEAVSYFVKVLDGVAGIRFAEPSGRVVHAEVTVGDSMFSLTTSVDEWGLLSPDKVGGSPLLLTLSVDDALATGDRMVEGGGQVIIPIEDRPYGKREGRVRDPFGHLWVISQQL
jgi:PhnB protein